MYKLRIARKAERQIKRIKRSHQEAILEALETIKDYPHLGKPLARELTGRFSFRVGMYRIIYKINEKDKTIFIFTAGHRATVYTK